MLLALEHSPLSINKNCECSGWALYSNQIRNDRIYLHYAAHAYREFGFAVAFHIALVTCVNVSALGFSECFSPPSQPNGSVASFSFFELTRWLSKDVCYIYCSRLTDTEYGIRDLLLDGTVDVSTPFEHST